MVRIPNPKPNSYFKARWKGIERKPKRLKPNRGWRNLESLKCTRVGPNLWLNLSFSHKVVVGTTKYYSRWCAEFPEWKYYKAVYKQNGKYIDARGRGNKTSRLILMAGWCFDVSDKMYTKEELKKKAKYNINSRRKRKREKEEAKVY